MPELLLMTRLVRNWFGSAYSMLLSCHTVGDQAVFDDGLDENASSCAIWARTGASETVYPSTYTTSPPPANHCTLYKPRC